MYRLWKLPQNETKKLLAVYSNKMYKSVVNVTPYVRKYSLAYHTDNAYLIWKVSLYIMFLQSDETWWRQ